MGGTKYAIRQRMKSPYVSVSDNFVLDISVSKAVATSAPKNATLEGTLLYKPANGDVQEESFNAKWHEDERHHDQPHYDLISASIEVYIANKEKIEVTYDGQVYMLYNDPSESHLEVDEDDALVIESGLLSGEWTLSGLIFRVDTDGVAPTDEYPTSFSRTIKIEHNSTYPQFVVVELRTSEGITVGLVELDGDDILLTLVDYDDNGMYRFTGIEKDTEGNISKFTSGKYLESGFVTGLDGQKPTVGDLTLEKV